MNSTGRLLRLTTFGESHGKAMGGILDGMPSGIKLDMDKIKAFLDRRRPGSSAAVTSRNESDIPKFLSGLSAEGVTLGTPIGFIIPNNDTRSADYDDNAGKFRPSHADFTYYSKYGIRDHRGGGRASARETASWVTAGAIVGQWLEKYDIRCEAVLTGAGDITMPDPFLYLKEDADVDKLHIYAPESLLNQIMDHIADVKAHGDSIGGRVSCLVTGVPAGLGDPVFGKLQSLLAQSLMGINAAKAFEYGIGFDCLSKRGSEVADIFTGLSTDGKALTSTNYSGGIQGGISNGMPIFFNVWFKPTPTVMKEFPTIDTEGKRTFIKERGRHDPCVALRAVPVVEARTLLTIGDTILMHNAYKGL